jgi:hypothetical protein
VLPVTDAEPSVDVPAFSVSSVDVPVTPNVPPMV